MLEIKQILSNKALVIPITVIVVTQFLKMLYFTIKDKKFSLSKLLTDGGMPSSHSALISSLTTVVGIELGFNSVYFAICAIFALIVMHDASGIRYAGGKHAVILNKIIEKDKDLAYELKIDEDDEKLIEFLGHTKLEVYCGSIVGVILTLIIYTIFL